MYGPIYHYLALKVLSADFRRSFFYVYTQDTDCVTQNDALFSQKLIINSDLLAQLTFMLHKGMQYVLLFLTLRYWAPSVSAPNPFWIIVNSVCRPTTEHVRQYNGLRSPEYAAIISEAEDSLVGRIEVVIRRCGQLNSTFSGRFGTNPVTHHFWSAQLRFFFAAWWRQLASWTLTSAIFLFKTSDFSYCYSHTLRLPILVTSQLVPRYFARQPSILTIRRWSALRMLY